MSYFNIITQSGDATVVTEYKPEKNKSDSGSLAETH